MALVKEVKVAHPGSKKLWDWPLQNDDGVVDVKNTSDSFEVGLKTLYYTPQEISVKVMGDKLSIQCSHSERSDKHGTVTREVNRVYEIPPDVDVSSIESNLEEEGLLRITGKKKK